MKQLFSILLTILSVCSVRGHDLFTAPLVPGDFNDFSYLNEEIVPKDLVNVTKPNVKILSLHVVTDIQYRYAITRVSSRVANHDNVSREVVFSLVVPETAFVSKFFMEIKNKTYDAYIKEKEAAKAEYTQAVAGGQAAAHVELSARDSNTFRVSVNVEPQSKVNFGMTYEQFLTRTLGRYEHVVNINPGQLVKNMSVTVNIVESTNITDLEIPELKTSNEITDEKETPNKLAEITRSSGNTATIKWEPTLDDQEKMNKEFGAKGQLVMRYDVDRSSNPDQILVDEGYFVHFYAPPNLPTLNKHVVFVLDLSGSMFGTKIAQLKDAMVEILSDLRTDDYFSIVLFSNKAHVWSLDSSNETATMLNDDAPPQNLTFKDHVIKADADNIGKAKKAIKEMDDQGGTNIIDGLRKSLEIAKVGREYFANRVEAPEPIVIFLTDGEPNVEMSDTEDIIDAVKKMNDHIHQVFSLAFGNGADYNFLRKLSLSNAAFARNIYEASDAALQLRNFYKQVASPLLSNVTFNYLPGQVEFNSTTKTQFSTLYDGSELVVAGKLSGKDELKRLSGNVAGRSVNGSEEFDLPELHNVENETHSLNCPIDTLLVEHFIEENRTQGHLERTWAYLYVQQLLDENSLDQAKINASKAKALALSLEYSFVTPLTSLVVVKPNETTKAVEADKKTPEEGHVYKIRSAKNLMLSRKSMSYHQSSLAPLKKVQLYKVGMNVHSFATSTRFGYQPAALSAASMAAPGFAPVYGPPPPIAPHAFFAKRPMTSGGLVYPGQFGLPPVMDSEAFTTPFDTMDRMDVRIPTPQEDENQYGTKTLTPDLTAAFENYAKLHNFTLGKTAEVPDTPYQECANSSSAAFSTLTSHHCKHVVHCLMNDITLDMNTYEPYHCVIDNKYLGVCCPDDIKPLNSNSTTSTSSPAATLANDTTETKTGEATDIIAKSATEIIPVAASSTTDKPETKAIETAQVETTSSTPKSEQPKTEETEASTANATTNSVEPTSTQAAKISA
uniref:Inter-alpha-trypsin inhibitor heavy chain H4 n=1 Tax=Cacopsylla melanoneura TaxID=428564 RepID=A0A8D8XU98_9HEMI